MICPRIEHIAFNFDPIGILTLCQQTELLFSMFIEPREKRLLLDHNIDKANRLLLDNFLEHLGMIHHKELELTKKDADRFTQEILLRHINTHPHVCPITESLSYEGKIFKFKLFEISLLNHHFQGIKRTMKTRLHLSGVVS